MLLIIQLPQPLGVLVVENFWQNEQIIPSFAFAFALAEK